MSAGGGGNANGKEAGVENKKVVTISTGPGTEPILIEYKNGDTVATVLQRAGVKIAQGQTATIGNKRVKGPSKTRVTAGDVIVVAPVPGNG